MAPCIFSTQHKGYPWPIPNHDLTACFLAWFKESLGLSLSWVSTEMKKTSALRALPHRRTPRRRVISSASPSHNPEQRHTTTLRTIPQGWEPFQPRATAHRLVAGRAAAQRTASSPNSSERIYMRMCAPLNNRCIFWSHSIGGTTASKKGNVDHMSPIDQMLAYAYYTVPHVLKERTNSSAKDTHLCKPWNNVTYTCANFGFEWTVALLQSLDL